MLSTFFHCTHSSVDLTQSWVHRSAPFHIRLQMSCVSMSRRFIELGFSRKQSGQSQKPNLQVLKQIYENSWKQTFCICIMLGELISGQQRYTAMQFVISKKGNGILQIMHQITKFYIVFFNYDALWSKLIFLMGLMDQRTLTDERHVKVWT